MNGKHTPAPWNIRFAEDRADAFIEYGDRSNINDPSARLIAQCFMHSMEDHANVRLIAAVPKLAHALQQCLTHCADFENMPDECATAFREARAALADAGLDE